MNKKNLANYVTMLRLLGTMVMIFCENYTMAFFVVLWIDRYRGWLYRKSDSHHERIWSQVRQCGRFAFLYSIRF